MPAFIERGWSRFARWYNRVVGPMVRSHDDWPMFRLGYMAALRDAERAGMLRPAPTIDPAKYAEWAFSRYVREGPHA